MHSAKSTAFFALLVVLLGGAACDTRTRSSSPRPSAADTDPFVKPAPPPTPKPEGPDWKTRYDTLHRSLTKTFRAPRIGKTITIQTRSGTEREGRLTALGDHEVTLAFDIGEISYPRVALHSRTRQTLFAEDYAHARVAEIVRRDRERIQAEPNQTSLPDGGTAASTIPFNDPLDQSVWQVKSYLEETLKDPRTIRYLEWSPIMKTGRGYQVVCTYRARAGSFGIVTEKKVFHLTRSGEVTAASPVRQNLERE